MNFISFAKKNQFQALDIVILVTSKTREIDNLIGEVGDQVKFHSRV